MKEKIVAMVNGLKIGLGGEGPPRLGTNRFEKSV